MSLALDTNVLIPWLVSSAPGHGDAKALVDAELRAEAGAIVVSTQVCWEFLHVVTDQRRFERPCTMDEASTLIRAVWNAPETRRLSPPPEVVPRVLDLIRTHRLGRKRILDMVLAATLEGAGVRRLATYNVRDFGCFPFLTPFAPGAATEPAT